MVRPQSQTKDTGGKCIHRLIKDLIQKLGLIAVAAGCLALGLCCGNAGTGKQTG